MTAIIKFIESILNLFIDPVPKQPKSLDDKISVAQEKCGSIPKSRHAHVNDFLETIALKITRHCIGTKIFPSMAIAQAALESGWNVNAKTIYGVKAIGWTGKTIDTRTREERNGQSYYITDAFRSYDNIDHCIKDYIKVLYTAAWFKDVLAADTVEGAIHGLQSDSNPDYKDKNYATAGNYEQLLNKLILDFGLKYFDCIKHEAENA
jgi:flagellum-specific peptidoglycan hydrolase FlgJ